MPRSARAAPRPVRRVVTAVVVMLAATLVPPTTGGSAHAQSAEDLRRSLQHLEDEVAAQERRVDRALAAYEGALDGLAGAVNASTAATREAEAAAREAEAARLDHDRQVRALYMGGGPLAVIDSLLAAQTPADLAARSALAARLVDLGWDAAAEAEVIGTSAQRRADRLDAAVGTALGTVQEVERAFRHLQDEIETQRQLIARLTRRADRLDEAERAADRLAAATAAAAAAPESRVSSATASGIPADFLVLYRDAAATCPGLPWPVLAAVGQVESGHGRNNGPSSAGALGPMQFLPSTFAGYAVDGDGDGVGDIWNPSDAVYSAARYLCANGAGAGPRGLYGALLRYNPVDWYVLLVMRVAGQIAERFGEPVPVATR